MTKIYPCTEYKYNGEYFTITSPLNIDRVQVFECKYKDIVYNVPRDSFCALIDNDIIRPVCGICNQPQHSLAYPHHVRLHLVNVHG